MRITVREQGEAIARFSSIDDAQEFAQAVTTDNDRQLELTDRAGWINLTYSNGICSSF
jgi:hypothetical protein